MSALERLELLKNETMEFCHESRDGLGQVVMRSLELFTHLLKEEIGSEVIGDALKMQELERTVAAKHDMEGCESGIRRVFYGLTECIHLTVAEIQQRAETAAAAAAAAAAEAAAAAAAAATAAVQRRLADDHSPIIFNERPIKLEDLIDYTEYAGPGGPSGSGLQIGNGELEVEGRGDEESTLDVQVPEINGSPADEGDEEDDELATFFGSRAGGSKRGGGGGAMGRTVKEEEKRKTAKKMAAKSASRKRNHSSSVPEQCPLCKVTSKTVIGLLHHVRVSHKTSAAKIGLSAKCKCGVVLHSESAVCTHRCAYRHFTMFYNPE